MQYRMTLARPRFGTGNAPWAHLRSIAMVLAILGGVVGCGASAGTTSTTAPAEPGAGTVVSDAPLTNVDADLMSAASWARSMTYRSRSGINDDNTHVTGSVFVPKGPPPEGGYPVVALAPETTGTSGDCAASHSPNLFGSSPTAVALLNSGFVVFVPDYQGLGKPSDGKTVYHPFLDSTTAGYVVIDGVRATKKVVPVATSTSWAALGSLEGGQAAWAANELVANYGSGLNLVATASLSPVADFEGLAQSAMAGTLTPDQKLLYVAFLAATKSENRYEFDLGNYRSGMATQQWEQLLACQNPHSDELAEQIPAQDLRPVDQHALTVLTGYLQKTTLPQGPTAAPMYVIYGGQDSMIPPAWTERALTRACQMGDVIQIAYWPGQDHRQIDPSAALGWLTDRLHAMPSANDCPSFLAEHTQ